MRLFCSAFMRTASSRIRDISSGMNSPSVRQSRPDRGEGGGEAFWRSGITMLTLPPPRALAPLQPGKRRLERYRAQPVPPFCFGERRRHADGRSAHQVDEDALIQTVLEDLPG